MNKRVIDNHENIEKTLLELSFMKLVLGFAAISTFPLTVLFLCVPLSYVTPVIISNVKDQLRH